jgi:taurine dioxygenase
VQIRPLSASLGAEVTGIDLAREPQRHAQELRSAFLAHGVLVVRDQKLTPDQFVGIARTFGPIEPYESTVKQYLMDGYPDIIVLSNIMRDGKPIGLRDAGQYWHTDRSYVQEPAWSSMLHAIKLPVDAAGVTRGATQFASSTAAWNELPEPLKRKVKDLSAVHRYVYRYTAAPENRLPPVEHPIALRHPYTGAASLYVNRGFTSHVSGMSPEDSDALLAELYAHAEQPRFVYTHQWKPGDLLFWDNFSTQHNAVSDYDLPLERLMWRTTIRRPSTVQ